MAEQGGGDEVTRSNPFAPPPPYEWVPSDGGDAPSTGRALPTTHGSDRRAADRQDRTRRRAAAVIVTVVVLVVAAVATNAVMTLNEEGARAPHATGTLIITTTASTTTMPPEVGDLRGRPRSPIDVDPARCTAELHAGGFAPVDTPAWQLGNDDAANVSEEDLRGELTRMMKRRFRADGPDRAVDEALAIYDAPAVKKATLGDPWLRAAVAALKGTIGEPAIDFVLRPTRPLVIQFSPMVGGMMSSSSVEFDAIRVNLSDGYEHESPALLAPAMFHELLHQSGGSHFVEELVAHVLDMRVAIEQLRDDPEALRLNTPLAKIVRYGTLAQLNSRVGSDLTATRSEAPVLPNTIDPPYPNLEAYLRAGPDNPAATLTNEPGQGNDTLTAVLRAMDAAGAPSAAAFDEVTLAFLDAHAGVGPCDQLAAATVLGVAPPTPTALAVSARALDVPG